MTALASVGEPTDHAPPGPDLFALALARLDFAHRPEQDRLVELLRDPARQRVAVQAGTGTGKSLAALCVAAERGRPGAPAVVVTMTNALTAQYTLKDAPSIAEAIGMTFTRIIGRSHYLCASSDAAVREIGAEPEVTADDLREFDGDEAAAAEAAEARWIARREAWLERACALNGRSTPATHWEANPDLHGRDHRCPGRCGGSQFGGCGARKARERGHLVDVIITNAHVLIYHTRFPLAGLLPDEIAYTLVDEAHALPDTVSSTLGARIGTEFGLRWAAEHSDITRMVVVGEDEEGRPNLVHETAQGIAVDLVEVVSEVRAEICRAVDWSSTRSPEVQVKASGAQRDRLRTALADYVRWQKAIAVGELDVPAPARDDEGADDAPEEVSIVETIELLAMTAGVPSVVASVSRGTPDEIGFVRTMVEKGTARALGPTAALISGTLPPSLPRRVGWHDVEPVDVGHPFDYARSVRGWISTHSGVKSCPARVTGAARQQWFARLADTYAARAAEIDRFIGKTGRGLILTPSHADVEVLREHLVPRLGARGVPVFVQPREGGSPAALEQAHHFRRQFETDGGPAVLIGTESLATGVDLPGELLTRVCWWCLPIGYTSPADEQRERMYPGYRTDRLRMRVAQGIGRLMRRTDDSGWVLLCDNRFNTHLAGATGILDRHLREIPWTRLRVSA